MMGGLNMIFYGCWLFAKPVNTDVFPPPDRETGKEAPFRRAYNVRVMIPCYKESLAIIQRTVLASKRADRPPGMKLVVYVCDDGNDEKKLAWVQRMNDPEVCTPPSFAFFLRSLLPAFTAFIRESCWMAPTQVFKL